MPFKREFTETNAAQGEFAQIAATTTTALAAIMHARGEDIEVHPFGFRLLDYLRVHLSILLFDTLSGDFQSSLQLVSFIL